MNKKVVAAILVVAILALGGTSYTLAQKQADDATMQKKADDAAMMKKDQDAASMKAEEAASMKKSDEAAAMKQDPAMQNSDGMMTH